jgi:hypothetical protein
MGKGWGSGVKVGTLDFRVKIVLGPSTTPGMRIGNPHFWPKSGGASIDYLRFSIYDWVESRVFGVKMG